MTRASDNGSAGEPPPGAGTDDEPRRATLPPPEWTAPREHPVSVASLTLELHTADPPVSRRTGPRAELAFHASRARACAAAGDLEGERIATTALARALVTRGSDLGEAALHARRALLIGHDPALREELAGWFAALGEPALAAATLRPLVPELAEQAAAAVLTRIGVLLGRAGDAAGAADALFDAAREDPSDPVAPELQAGVGAWAPNAVSAERAAEGYLEGFRRREALGERAAAFEDLLRAFEMAPGEPAPAERLAGSLAIRGRTGAADEVLREHARALGDPGRAVHLRRLREALAAGDVARALGAAFDARLDADLDSDAVGGDGRTPGFDELLERAGLHELRAARLEIVAERREGFGRSAVRCALGRVYAGPLASPERAAEAWVDALVSDPECTEARTALEADADASRDPTTLAEAYLRIAEHHSAPRARHASLVELAELAERRLQDPALALWAARQGLAITFDAELSGAVERLEPAAQELDAQLERAERQLAEASGADRLPVLRELAGLLRARPDRLDRYQDVLSELADRAPTERVWQRTLDRILTRAGRQDEIERRLVAELAGATGTEQDRVRLALSALRRRRGDLDGATAALSPLLEDGGAHFAGLGTLLVLAAARGDERTRARALLRIAAPLSPSLRAVLTAVAAESLLAAGDAEAARKAAEQAHSADPSQVRPVAVLAAVALHSSPDRAVAEALERAMGFIVPRAALCEALATAHEALGDPALSLLWTQRWLSLRPGDPRAARTLLGRITESGDATRIADALGWLLSQPQPLHDVASSLGAALLRLAELDPARGAAMARRALDVLGPRARELGETVIAISDAADEPGLAIAVLERTLAAGCPESERAALLLEIARRRRLVGDADGAARALCRAVRDGAAPERVLETLGDALPARSSDGELALLEARAEALVRSAGADAESAARAFRELGAARWDLAGDADGAVEAWERSASLEPGRGLTRFARDLVSFGGHAEAMRRLELLAARQQSPTDVARLLGVAATVALAAGESKQALRAAARVIEIDPSQADILAVAERATDAEDIGLLDQIYSKVSDASLGCYGERAVHYRAARQFERRGDSRRALGHAVRAFEAVPAAGITFVLMSRLAERVGDASQVVHALERVAEATPDVGARAVWLKRAALLGGNDEEGTRLRVELLLRAIAVRPEAALIESLGAALREMMQISPEYREIAELRFAHAIGALLERGEGPEGARIGVTAARVALEVLGRPAVALTALGRAIGCDADIDEFGELVGHAEAIARERAGAEQLVARVRETKQQPYSNVGRGLLELTATLARALGDAGAAAELMVAAAERDPDDADLARRAALSAQLAGDPALMGKIAATVPTAERIGGLMEMAAGAAKSGDIALAIDALEQVEADRSASADDRRRARMRLRELYARVGRHSDLERILTAEVERRELTGTAMSRAARDLAALLGTRGKPAQAMDVLTEALRTFPDDLGMLEDLALLAHQGHDHRRRAMALSALADRSPERDRARVLRELAPLLEEIGDDAGASARWAELSALEPNDIDALAALERNAEKREDWERAAALLSRRAGLATRVDEVRRIRLRRASLLELRLGRADEARAELEALLAATGDHLSVLRVLADLHERLGAPLRAGPLWMRASAATGEREEARDLGRRACEAFLAGGDVEAARRVLEGMQAWAHSVRLLELRVEVEQKAGDARGLAAALEDLAGEVAADSPRHVELLVQAARAHERAGDTADALAAAERAAELAHTAAEPQLLAAWLEYRVRGPSTREHARLVVAALRAIEGALDLEQAALRGFLIADALDIAVGSGAGMRELSKLHAELGTPPLIALGMAERLAEGGEHARALPLYDLALAGDLRAVRSRGRVAIAAAESARQVDDLDRALGYVEIAAADEPTRIAAIGLGNELRTARRDRDAADQVVMRARKSRRPPPQSELPLPEDPDAAPHSLPGPRDSEPPPPPDLLPGPRESARQGAVSDRPRVISDRPVEPRMRSGPPPLPSSPPVQGTYSSTAPPERVSYPAPGGEPKRRSAGPPPLPVATTPEIRDPEPPPQPARRAEDAGPGSHRRMTGQFRVANPMESELADRLDHGALDAGLELIRQLENRRSRAHDLVAVCRRVVALAPGDRNLLRQLHAATLDDRNFGYARCVEHVLSLLDPAVEAVAPPPLADQPEDPERVRALLQRDVARESAEALALVWEGASHVFRRDPSIYGVTGVERVPPTAQSPLARVYAGAARVLGLGRTPLFQRRGPGAVTLSVALFTPPALVVTGEVTRETADLRYHLGAMLAASMPEQVLLFGNLEEQARGIFKALTLAFGKPQEGKATVASAAALAEALWERIPARSQRRLRELCHSAAGLDYDTAFAAANRVVRRAGLFVSGDLRTTVRELCRQDGEPVDAVAHPDTFGELIARSEAVADVVRLATSSEYAAARWHPPRARQAGPG